MSESEAFSFVDKIKGRYLFLRFTEVTLIGLTFVVFAFAVLELVLQTSFLKIFIPAMAGLMAFTIRSFQLSLFSLKDSALARYLSRHYLELEESTDLLLQNDESLTLLQRVQKQRAIAKLELLNNSIRLPHQMGTASLMLLSGLAIFLVVNQLHLTLVSPDIPGNASEHEKVMVETNQGSAVLIQASIQITPPSYTAIKSFSKSDLNLSLPEGSKVNWSIEFTGNPKEVLLIFSTLDTLKLTHSAENLYTTQRTFIERGFYQIQWMDAEGLVKSSDFKKIDIIKDQPPKITVENLAQFTELSFEENRTIKFTSTISDDYGLLDAYIIATVSKGSGESVKFREEKMHFDHGDKIEGKHLSVQRTIDFHKLGMEPGDELYFYVESVDNKAPVPNYSRTETWFVALLDTATESESFDAGMGVDLMPEYFRSQRQIIIDTEKLLAEKSKKQVTKENFNYRSNELGYDQKVLRLRYGQFLGEEFESSIVQSATEEEAPAENEEDIAKKYGHVHDKENEHNLVKEKSPRPEENKQSKEEKSGEQENPLKTFAHQHDTGEESTFFVQSVKTKLKAALALMWDAELQLRLYDPGKSLPYQYRILKLLKEISNDSRVYVHRNGFDPPPLKEEKRLTGDLMEVKNSSTINTVANELKYPAIRQALRAIEILIQMDSVMVNERQRAIFRRAGNEIAVVALEEPGKLLQSLSLLKSVVNNEIESNQLKQVLIEIRCSLWTVLPQALPSPTGGNRLTHPMDKSLVKYLDSQLHE